MIRKNRLFFTISSVQKRMRIHKEEIYFDPFFRIGGLQCIKLFNMHRSNFSYSYLNMSLTLLQFYLFGTAYVVLICFLYSFINLFNEKLAKKQKYENLL